MKKSPGPERVLTANIYNILKNKLFLAIINSLEPLSESAGWGLGVVGRALALALAFASDVRCQMSDAR